MGSVYAVIIVSCQVLLNVCLSDVFNMLSYVANTTLFIIPRSMAHVTTYIDKYYRYYSFGIIMTTFCMALTNSMILESFWHFPLG